MENMEQVVMPELITPRFAEVIAENPEMFRIITDHQSGEGVIAGKNCTIDCGNNPANIKLVLCNVTIGIDENADESDKVYSSKKAEEQIEDLHIKIVGNGQKQGNKSWGELLKEQSQLKLDIAVLEARVSVIRNILRLIPRQIFNRKLVARCKKEIIEAEVQLASKKKELEYSVLFKEYGEH